MQATVKLDMSALSLSRTSCLVRPLTLRRIRFPSDPKPSEIAPT
jgi:hypothetical protein